MRTLTLDEILTATATDTNALKQWRNRGQIAMAFGRTDAYQSLTYFALDAVALMLTDTLAKSHGRKFAAQAVRIYWDVWAAVVAYAEADPSRSANFCIVDFVLADGKKGHLVCGASGTIDEEEIALRLAGTPQAKGAEPERIVCVNVARLIRFMRENGARHGIDFSGVFLPGPDDPRTRELLAPWTQAREAAVDKLAALKAKDEAAASRAGRIARSALEAYAGWPEGTTAQ